MRSSITRVRGAGIGVCLLICGALASSGCGAIFLGSTQLVTVHTNPPSATVRVLQTGYAAETPALVPLARDGNFVLVVEAPGYRTVHVPLHKSIHLGVLLGDILTFPIGLIVDAVTRSWYVHQPRMIFVTLEPGSAPAAPPPVRREK